MFHQDSSGVDHDSDSTLAAGYLRVVKHWVSFYGDNGTDGEGGKHATLRTWRKDQCGFDGSGSGMYGIEPCCKQFGGRNH
jgi:hypothetical protein